MSKFVSKNAEQLVYQNELLKLTVLGGIKLDGLDRMRCTLKIQLCSLSGVEMSSIPPVRHSVDLYNDTQTEKLIRKAAEKLELGTSILTASISELTENLETYRLERIKEKQPERPGPKPLTEEETKTAQAFLKEPDLLKRTNQEIGKAGMIGEVDNRLLMYLIFTSRKQNQPLHVVSLGASGMGKTHLQEKIAELIPENDKIEITTLSENAFYYFGQRELKNKLILIEDLDGAESSLYPLRELQSKKRISKTIAHKNTKGETKTIHLVVEGPISVAGCTTKEQIYEDNANRSFLIYLDESEAQDQKIMEYQRKQSAGKTNKEQEQKAAELLRNCQSILEPIRVVNPFAEVLQIPKEVFKPRRTNNHYLQFIEVITFYHQYQREQKVNKATGEIYIETTLEDIKEANELLKPVLLRKSDDLSGATRNHLEALKTWVKENGKLNFGNREVSRAFRRAITTIKRYHWQLVELGYLELQKQKNVQKHQYKLSYLAQNENREQAINRSLAETLHKAETMQKTIKTSPTSPVPAHTPNGLVKSVNINKKKQPAQ